MPFSNSWASYPNPAPVTRIFSPGDKGVASKLTKLDKIELLSMKNKLTQAFTLIAMGLIAFYVATRSPSFDQFRAVDVVLLLAAGLRVDRELTL